MAATRAGGDAKGGESEIPTETSVAVYVLWHTHQVRYASAHGTLPLGVGPVMAVPSVMVYRLEEHAAGLDGPCSRSSQCAGGDKEGQPRNAFPAMDSHTPGVHRFADVSTLRHLK